MRISDWSSDVCSSDLLVGVLYLLTLASAYTGVVSYSSIYNLLHQSDEFIFRHNPNYGVFIGFLYKGVFYVCIAALFLLFDPFRWTKFLAAALIISDRKSTRLNSSH